VRWGSFGEKSLSSRPILNSVMMSEENLLSDILNNSPSVELLRLRNREIIILFLYKTFYRHREPVAYEALRMRLTDYLSSIHLENDEENDITSFDSYDEKAYKYIQRWTDKGFLRNYQEESGEVFYELSSYASKAIDWLISLKREEFVGTESKFMNLFGQIKELVEFTNEDASERIRMLEQKKMEIEHQIQSLQAGESAVVYEEYQVLPRFRDITRTAKELLSDFKEVEDNFKSITKSIYQKHAEGEISKGDILGFTFDALEKLQTSSQGKSFYAFWDFLMTPSMQDTWDKMVSDLYSSLDAKQMKQDDMFLRNMKGYLYNSGKKVYQANDKMADKLSRIICENGSSQTLASQRLIQDIQALLLQLAGQNIKPEISLEVETQPEIFMPLERKLTLERSADITYDQVLEMADADISDATGVDRLFVSHGVDREVLKRRISLALTRRKQVSLPEVIEENGGLEKGLSELFGYISVIRNFRHTVNPERMQLVEFNSELRKSINIPEIIVLK
jgi:hypothetical protein